MQVNSFEDTQSNTMSHCFCECVYVFYSRSQIYSKPLRSSSYCYHSFHTTAAFPRGFKQHYSFSLTYSFGPIYSNHHNAKKRRF